VPAGWTAEAVKTQVRLAAGRVQREAGIVRVGVGRFDVAGFSVPSLAFLHQEIFVKLAYYFRAERPDPVIVDGGSNIGMSVFFFKTLYPNARVLAFEPAGRAFDLLRRNVQVNTVDGVELHPVALGREDADVPFYEDPADPATFRMSTRPGRLDGSASAVAQRRLSSFISDRLDLLKLDVEGAEDDILGELTDSGALARIDQVIVEYHHHLDPERDFLDRFLERLRDNGFAYQVSAAERVAERKSRTPPFRDVLVYARRRNSPST